MPKIPNVLVRKRKLLSGNISYAYYFYGPDVNGKRNQISKTGFKSEKEALAAGTKARDLLYTTGKSERKDKGDISVSDFINNVWFPARSKARNWQETTKQGYQSVIKRQIAPVIGKYPLRCITVEHLQEILDDMYDNRGFSHNTVSNLHALFLNIFNYAIDHDYIDKLYLSDLVVPKKDEDYEYELLSHRHQVRDVIPSDALDKIFTRFSEDTSAFLPMVISLYTGARLGEIFGLAWEDIDFENGIISIERQMIDDKVFYVCNPKYNSKRKVPICPTLMEILLNEKAKQEENIKYNGPLYLHTYLVRRENTETTKNKHGVYDIYSDYGDKEIHFVNVYDDGQFKTPSIMKHASRIIHGYSSYNKSPNKKEKGEPLFEDFNMHSYRHTFASLLNSMDIDPMLLSALMGHKKKAKEGMANITTRYIHLDDEYIKRATKYIQNIYDPVWKKANKI